MPDNLPILGTTATANDRVVADVQAQLGGVGIQRGPLMRETLALQTIRLPSQAARLAWLADHMDALPGTGIIYTLTKRDANQVTEDKHQGRFRNDLVGAVVEMLRERWLPSPPPQWVTCVPSRRHPDLVPDVSERLSDELGLPFDPIVRKVRDNDPQKAQENRFHQYRNLDGVFAIDGAVRSGPVLLIDDVVDSGWTLTVVAALLRQAGSGPVWPLALATSYSGT